MKKKRFLQIVVLLLLSGGALCGAVTVEPERHIYLETTGDTERLYQWRLEAAEHVKIVSKDDTRTFTTWCKPDGSTFRWRVVNSGGDRLVAERVDDKIRIQGTHNGETVDREIRIDAKPWYQPLSFSLRRLARGATASEHFWTIRSDSLSPLEMKAVRESIEVLDVAGQAVETVRVRVFPTGWRSVFWKCSYWFREHDQVFVRYIGVHGPPGTPRTVIELASDN